MKNPKSNLSIEAIKARMLKEIGYMPSDNIPNSYISKKLEKLDANATLEYAKLQNKPVRKAYDGECEYTIMPKLKAYQKVDVNKPSGMFSTKEAAERIGIKVTTLHQYKKTQHIFPKKVGSRLYYPESEIERFSACRKKIA